MLSSLAAIIILLAQDPYSLAGPFAWGERDFDAPSDGPTSTVAAKIYYPAEFNGAESPISAVGGPFPIVAFAHGFVVAPEFYDSTLRHLATRGYVVVATRSQQGSFAPDREQYISDFLSSIDFLVHENSVAGSIFEGRLDTHAIGTSGHSLGGGVAIVATARDDRVKANATFSAASLRSSGPLGDAPPPYADVDVASLDIPVSLINGSLDALIPVPTNGQVIYDAADGPRLLPNQIGGYHVGFTDFPLPPPFGDAGQPGSVTQEENLAFARAELTSFFDLYLKGDQSAWRRQWGPERLNFSLVETQFDPGMVLVPALAAQTLATGQIVRDLLVTNTSDHADRYDFFVEENFWEWTFSVDQSPLLAPGESFGFQVVVTPPDVLDSLFDVALISARSDLDGGTRAFVYVTTAVPEFSAATSLFVASATVVASRLARRFVRKSKKQHS